MDIGKNYYLKNADLSSLDSIAKMVLHETPLLSDFEKVGVLVETLLVKKRKK